MARSVPRSALRSCAHREAAGRCNSPATAAPGSGAASPSTGHPDSSRRPARRRSRGYDRSSPYMGCSKLRQGRSITENPTATTYIGFLEQQGYEQTLKATSKNDRFLKSHPDARTRIVAIIWKRRWEDLDRAKEETSNRR